MPTKKGKSVTILVAEDDEDDRLLMQEALEENRLANDLHFVGDGVELLDYLQQIPIKPATKEPTEKAQSRCHNDETN
jgi:CheY-like chemotaxis protein